MPADSNSPWYTPSERGVIFGLLIHTLRKGTIMPRLIEIFVIVAF